MTCNPTSMMNQKAIFKKSTKNSGGDRGPRNHQDFLNFRECAANTSNNQKSPGKSTEAQTAHTQTMEHHPTIQKPGTKPLLFLIPKITQDTQNCDSIPKPGQNCHKPGKEKSSKPGLPI